MDTSNNKTITHVVFNSGSMPIFCVIFFVDLDSIAWICKTPAAQGMVTKHAQLAYHQLPILSG